MEKNNHKNQPTGARQNMHSGEVKKTDEHTKKPEASEPAQKPTTPHTK